MQKFLITAIFFCPWLLGVGQVQVTVVDKSTDSPIPGVTLYVKNEGSDEKRAIGTTNEEGRFEILNSNLPYTLVTSHIGFTEQQIIINSQNEITLSLEPSATTLTDVVVTGQFEPQSVRQSVYQVRTINSERIALRSPVNVQGVLSTELGIRFSNDLTLGTSDISLMGMSGQNVKVLLDGVPVLDRGETRESLNQIDVNTIERIEIIEGPMSVIYGSDALAGVINIITKKNTTDKISVEAKIHEETAGDEYEPFAGKGSHNENVGLNWTGKKWYAGGSATRNTFGGWNEGREVSASVEGEGEWHPKNQLLSQGVIGYKLNSLNVWYRLSYLNEKITALGNPINDAQVQVVDKEYITNRFNHQFQAEWDINDKWSFNGAASYQDYSRRTLTTNYNLLTGEETLSTEPGSQAESMYNMGVVRGIFLYKMSPTISLQQGFDINTDNGSGDRIEGKPSINDYAAFVSVELKPSDKINIRPGLRFIYNSDYDAPPVVPSLNTKFALSSSLDLRLAYAYGFRSPALRELYFYFFDASHSIKGNPDLKAEYSNSFSGSLTWNSTQAKPVRVKTVLNSFYNVFDNLITIAQDPADPTVYTYVNVLKYKTTGATIENNFYYKNISLSLGASYIGRYNQFTEEDTSLPEFLWATEFNAVGSYALPKTNTTFSMYYKYTGVRQTYAINNDTNEIELGEIEDFHLLDISVSQPFLKYLTLTTGIKNLLDVTQLQNSLGNSGGGHSSSGNVPMSYGRSYFATLAVRWSK